MIEEAPTNKHKMIGVQAGNKLKYYIVIEGLGLYSLATYKIRKNKELDLDTCGEYFHLYVEAIEKDRIKRGFTKVNY